MKQFYLAILGLFVFSFSQAKSIGSAGVPSATITGTTTVCQNTLGTIITFTGSGGTLPYTFTYKIGTGANMTVSTTGTDKFATVVVNTATIGTLTYKLVSVHDAAAPSVEQVSTGTAVVTVISEPNTDLNSTADYDVFNGVPIFKVCSNVSTVIDFFNASTTAATNTSYTINWGDGTPVFTSSNWTSTSHTYSEGLWYLKYTIQGQSGCSATKIFQVFIGNNPAVGLGNPGNTEMCITESLTFPITGTENNPPGTTYVVTFNDGSAPITYNHPPPASVTHTFLKTSCGTTSTSGPSTYQNSFYASIIAKNPCDQSSAAVIPIRISTVPVADFNVSAGASGIGCLNKQVCITNTSWGGEAVSASVCTPPKMVWSISPNTGFTLASGTMGNDFGSTSPNAWANGTSSICPVFTVPGTYSITLKVGAPGNKCNGIDQITKTICIDPTMVPTFTVNTNSGCMPLSVTTSNTTNLLGTCSPPTYSWSVTYASGNCGNSSGYTYTNGTNASSLSPSFNFTASGIYTIKLTVTNSCGSFSSTQVIDVKKPPTVSINPIGNFCDTASFIPKATVNSCGAVNSSLTYAWSFPGGSPSSATTAAPGTITYASVGNYTVSLVVTNECGVSGTATQTFSVNPSPKMTNTILEQTICSGTQNSAIGLTADLVGTTFSWTAVATSGITGFATSGNSSTIPSKTISSTSNSVGQVTYTITPSLGGCNGSPIIYVIKVNPAPVITTQPASSVVCLGGIPAPLSVMLSSSAGSPSYQWYSNTSNTTSGGTLIPNETGATFSPQTNSVGTQFYYCLISLTSGGCSTLTSNTASITVNPLPVINNQPLPTQSLCLGGAISVPLFVSVSGNPSYQWYANSINANSNGVLIPGATSASYTPPVFTTSGAYYFYAKMTYPNSGCGNLTSDVAAVVVTNPPTTTQPIVSQTVCQGSMVSDLAVTPTGNGTFTYQWYSNSKNNTTTGTIIFGATNNIYNPEAKVLGTTYYYCKIIQDGISTCSVTSETAKVEVIQAPVLTSQPVSSITCVDGNPSVLKFTYANGVGTPTYQWFSNIVNSNAGGTLLSGATAATFSPMAASVGTTYYYCVINFPAISGSCSVLTTNTASVVVNPLPIIASETATICSTNVFTIIPNTTNGNTIPMGTTYTWSTPVVSPIGSVLGASAQQTPQTSISQMLTNKTSDLATVKYIVTPKSGDCVGASFTITVTVAPAIKLNTIVKNSTCFGINNGEIIATITGGIPYTTGVPYQISWTGPNGFSASTAEVSNLSVGDYFVAVSSEANCAFSEKYTITEPDEIKINLIKQTNGTCFGSTNGSLDIEVLGGTGNYLYSWTKNGVPFATTQDISGLSPAEYVVSVTDANNCGPIKMTYFITEPAVLAINIVSQRNVFCYDTATGSVAVQVAGGTKIEKGPGVFDYSYSWSGPNGFSSDSKDLNSIKAGSYSLKVTDKNGCAQITAVTIEQSSELVLMTTTKQLACYGDTNASIKVDISGGNAPYQFYWSNLSANLDQTNLTAGNYTIVVSDSKGCQKSETITILEVPVFKVNPVITNVSCHGLKDGSIIMNFEGGVAPVTLSWSDKSPEGTTRNNLAAGTYSVVIQDAKSCVIAKTFNVVEPNQINLSAKVNNALDCENAASGSIELLATGGNYPYNYLWSNGVTAKSTTNLTPGLYNVIVTDAKGCSETGKYSITRQSPIEVEVTTTYDFDCEKHKDDFGFYAKISGGIPPYKVQWSIGKSSGDNNEIMHTSSSGMVILTITDSNSCKVIKTLETGEDHAKVGYANFELASYANANYGIYSIEDPIQFNSAVTGDILSIVWDFGDGTFSTELNPIHTYLIAKDYTVTQTVTYAHGCIYEQKVYLTIEKGYVLVAPNAFTPNNYSVKDGINDTYRPVTKMLKNVRLDIYDTWGSLIYSEVGEVIKGWDAKVKGRNAENGNYNCRISGETFYGTFITEEHTFVVIE